MTISNLERLRRWANHTKTAQERRGTVDIREPRFENGGLVVDMLLERAIAQVILWPSGMLDLTVLSTEPDGKEIQEHYEIKDEDDLTRVLNRVALLVCLNEQGNR